MHNCYLYQSWPFKSGNPGDLLKILANGSPDNASQQWHNNGTTMAHRNQPKLDRVQNEAMRVILGTTKDTPTETTKLVLDLTPMQTRQKVEQVKAYFGAVENPYNSLHEAVKDTKGCRPGRGKSWMGQAEDSILQVCQLRELKQKRNGKGTRTDSSVSVRHVLLPENV